MPEAMDEECDGDDDRRGQEDGTDDNDRDQPVRQGRRHRVTGVSSQRRLKSIFTLTADHCTLSTQESPADARVTRDSAVIPRWPSAAILNFIEPQIASFDPPTAKTLVPEPDMEWIGCTVCEIFAFALYCDLETGVRGHSRSSKTAPFDRAQTTLYSSSIVTMPLSLTVAEI